MNEIKIPETIHQLTGLFYRLQIWNDSDVTTIRDHFRKFFYLIYIVFLLLSTAVGALITDDKDECVFLILMSVLFFVQVYRMWIILWRKNGFLLLIRQATISINSTVDQNEFNRINNELNNFMKFLRYILFAVTIGCFYAVAVFPITNNWHFVLNIAFPVDRNDSGDIAFWMEYVFVCGGVSLGIICDISTKMIWFLMMNMSLKYKIFGNQLRNLGTIRTRNQPKIEVTVAAREQLFRKNFIDAIQTYERINETLVEFTSNFWDLFFLQISTSSACICGSVYTLAFSSNENLIQNGIYCIVLTYSFFDIFIVMYLGNEIKLSCDELSQHAFESNWIEQTQSCKMCIVILMERLKRPLELIVGKIYPLNLLTFTSIVRSAYSMFNILQKFR